MRAATGLAGDELTITGGYGGTTARLEDLERCATVLDAAAPALRAAGEVLVRLERQLIDWERPYLLPTPEQSAAVTAARTARIMVEPLRTSVSGTAALAPELEGLARGVRAARSQYVQSESFASRAFDTVWNGMFTGFSLSGMGPVVALATLGVALPVEALLVLSGRPIPGDRAQRYVGTLANAMLALRPGPYLPHADPVPSAAGRLSWMVRVAVPRSDVVALPVIGTRKEGRPPRGVKGLVDRYEDVSTGGQGRTDHRDGVVVEKITRPDGTTAWSITIPGTQKAGLGVEEHPFDNLSNLELEAGVVADSTKAVLAAMAQAGVGKDDPVVLTGHSQGGLVAQQIASSGTYAVAAVLTLGSPTGTRTMKSKVPTIHIEHESDLIPTLDSKHNPEDPLTTTVRRKLRDKRASDPVDSHATDTYEETAALIDSSDHPSVKKWRETVDEALGSGGTSEQRLYSVHRRDTAL